MSSDEGGVGTSSSVRRSRSRRALRPGGVAAPPRADFRATPDFLVAAFRLGAAAFLTRRLAPPAALRDPDLPRLLTFWLRLAGLWRLPDLRVDPVFFLPLPA